MNRTVVLWQPGLPVGMVDTLFQYADSKEATEAVALLTIL